MCDIYDIMIDCLKEFGEPESIDESGKPHWPDWRSIRCCKCEKYLPNRMFYGKWKKRVVCKDCCPKELKDRKIKFDAPNPCDGAYTHVIRKDETGELYRAWMITNPPEGYTIVFVSNGGYNLPRTFWNLEIYDENKGADK